MIRSFSTLSLFPGKLNYRLYMLRPGEKLKRPYRPDLIIRAEILKVPGQRSGIAGDVDDLLRRDSLELVY
jgi:hypothetical protein